MLDDEQFKKSMINTVVYGLQRGIGVFTCSMSRNGQRHNLDVFVKFFKSFDAYNAASASIEDMDL